MTDPFTDVADELMTRTTDLGSEPAPPAPSTGAKTKKHVCPYCGAVTAVVEKPTGPCPRCNMEDTPATRAATKARIGPWYVLQSRNPSAPGMKWATLLSLVSKGQVTPRSVVRGPTTHQLWKFAAHIKGLSREFNLCYSCGGEIDRTANQCPHCDRLQEPPVNPDSLLESRDLSARTPVQREIKQLPQQSTDLVLAGGSNEMARPKIPDEGILSAKELAAAFQLDFNPQPPAEIEEPRPRKKARPGRAFAALVLLAAIAGGGVLMARPDYRAKTLTWANSTIASIKTSIDSNKSAPKVAPNETGTPPLDKVADQSPPAPSPTPAAQKQEPQTPANPAPEPTQAQAAAPTAAPAPAPASAEQPQVQSPVVDSSAKPPPAPAPSPAHVEVAQAPQVTAPPAAPAPAPQKSSDNASPAQAKDQQAQERIRTDIDAPVPSDADREAQKELGRRLWSDGFKAQTLGDFPLAIKCYDRLKTLNREARQPDLLIDREIEFCNKQLP